MPYRLLNARLAAHSDTGQVELVDRADRLADEAERYVRRVWNSILRLIHDASRHPTLLHAQLRPLVQQLQGLPAFLRERFTRLGTWAHRQETGRYRQLLPRRLLRDAAVKRLSRGMYRRPGLRESVELREDAEFFPGLIQLLLGQHQFQATDVMSVLRDPENIADDLARKIFDMILFPPPEPAVVASIVYGPGHRGGNWYDRLASVTKLAAPEPLAYAILQGYAAGEMQTQIAKRLLPIVGDVMTSARRIARTEGMRVANTLQMRAADPIQDFIVGWQVRATLDQNTRPAHRERHNTVYFKQPKPGQKGLDEMPHPPMEADGSYAFNCRCRLSAIMSAPSYAIDTTVLDTNPLMPDTLTYSQWFEKATERQRRLAVGTKRYSAVVARFGTARYADFVQPDGGLVSVDKLKIETDAQRSKRLAAIDRQERKGEILRRRLEKRGHL